MIGGEIFGTLSEKHREYVTDIRLSSLHLLGLIDEILDLSKIEAGVMEISERDVDLLDVSQSALMLVNERAERAGLVLENTIPIDGLRIRGDQRMVKQMLVNLLSNAIKFTPAGGQVCLSSFAVGDNGISLSVSDRDDFRWNSCRAGKIWANRCRSEPQEHGDRARVAIG